MDIFSSNRWCRCWWHSNEVAETYSESCQTSRIEFFAKIAAFSRETLTDNLGKSFILGNWFSIRFWMTYTSNLRMSPWKHKQFWWSSSFTQTLKRFQSHRGMMRRFARFGKSSLSFNVFSMVALVGRCLLDSISPSIAVLCEFSCGEGVVSNSAQLGPMFSVVFPFLQYPQSPGFCTD